MNQPSVTPALPAARPPWYYQAAYFLFWSWNLIFLAFVLLGLLPQLLPDIVQSVQSGLIPPLYGVLLLLLVLIPFLAVVLGFTRLRKAPGRLLTLGYVIEGPLMLMLLVRMFAIRQGNPAVDLLMFCAGLGMLACLWALLHPAEPRVPLGQLRLGGLSLLTVLALYAALVLAFYVPPLAVFLVRAVADTFSNLINSLLYSNNFSLLGLSNLPFMFLGFILLVYTGTLILGMPIAAPWLMLRIWGASWRRQAAQSPLLALAAVLLPLVVGSAGLINGLQQPQGQAYALVQAPPTSLAQAQSLLQHAEQIRTGLLNAYLAPYRYLSAVGELNHIRDLYAETLKLSDDVTWPLEQVFDGLLSPLLYQPLQPSTPETVAARQFALQKDPVQAAELYQRVFDQPILTGEKSAIVTAVRSTFSGSQAEIAWQAVDDREVHLKRQEVTLSEHGDWAEVELYEVYQNRSFNRQEVVYYFSLPESAVITGVWLGTSPDRSLRSVYQVAPRGAAQEVYKREVSRRIDPALVEQVGPRQYRLRVFPVEPARNNFADSGITRDLIPGADLHMWLTFRVLAANGAWPLPQLAERRNVYWDAESVRLINGQPSPANQDTWLPPSAAARAPITPTSHRFTFPGGETVLVQPYSPAAARPLNQVAVILDRSYSMSAQAAPVTQALRELQNAASGGVDLYLSAAEYRGEPASRVAMAGYNPAETVYIGGQDAAELLQQFAKLRGSSSYSAVFILTDKSGYQLSSQPSPVTPPEAPLWIIHLGGAFPLGYDDPTLAAIQASGGGVAASVPEALQRLQARLNTAGGDAIDGYLWQSFAPGAALPAAPAATAEPAFAPLAARRLVLDEMNRSRTALEQLPVLDRMHAVAVANSIVTPYSSMIVLVNDAQKRLLEQLSQSGDRFEREAEAVGETQQFNITGVPEPHEWLLLALVLALLVYLYRTRKPALRSL